KVEASFSILGDMVKQVGGHRVEVVTFVGPNGDAHVYEPTPADAKALSESKILVINGLGLEGRMTQLENSSGCKVVTASNGVKPRKMVGDEKTIHARQDLGNGKIYAAKKPWLIAADPAGKAPYEANAKKFIDGMTAMEADVKQAVAKLPLERRKIIATHDARPLAVAGVAMILAGLMEALQGFTADRIPDLPTALSGAAGRAGWCPYGNATHSAVEARRKKPRQNQPRLIFV